MARPRGPSYSSTAVVSSTTTKTVELLRRREDAERFLEQVGADDAELAERLRVEPIQLDA